MNEAKLFGKRLQRQADLETEQYIFKCLCHSTKHLLRKVEESTGIYSTMYQLAETCLTSRFVRESIVDEHRMAFSALRAATEEKKGEWIEYFASLQSISTRELTSRGM